jgi:hypothetical protein
MPQALGSLGSFFSSNMGNISKLLAAGGTAANVYSGVNNAINQSNYNSTQSYIQNLVKNPAKLAAAAQQYQQPLSAGLTDAVTNQAQAQLAERGLGGSPAAMQSVIAQSLAPYIQQNQQTAIQTLLQSLNAGTGARPTALPQMDLSKLMAQLKLGGGPTSDPTNAMVQTGFGDTQTTQPIDFGSVDFGDQAVAA